jgi:hypothetical protein
MSVEPESWAPQACALPTTERPLRIAEFDDLFARAVRDVVRRDATTVWLNLEPTAEIAAWTADLVVRESGCCSFFTFSLVATGGELRLDVTVPAGRVEVLDALAARAAGVSS